MDGTTLAVVKTERRTARADFVSITDTTQEISMSDAWMTRPEYAALGNIPGAGDSTLEELTRMATDESLGTPPVSAPLHRNLVYEASDGAGRYSIYAHLNPSLRVLSEAQLSRSQADGLDRNPQQQGGEFGFRVFTTSVTAELRPAENQALIRPILSGRSN